jgi:hypothetical protein
MDFGRRKSGLMNGRAASLACAALLLVAACTPQWVRVDAATAESRTESGFVGTLPTGWVRFSNPNAKFESLASRDGVRVQFITMGSRKISEAFPRLNKPAPKGALSTDLADLELAEQLAMFKPLVVKAVESLPVSVAGQRAFRLLSEYKTESGLTMRRVTVAWMSGDDYSYVRFEAPALHYYERDLPEFNKFVQSVRRAGS